MTSGYSKSRRVRQAYRLPIRPHARDRRSLYQRQRSALITMAYTEIRKHRLDLDPAALRQFCEQRWTAPVISDYDAGMGGESKHFAIPSSKIENLINGVVAHVIEHFNEEVYRSHQQERARRPRPGSRVSSVEKLLALPEGMSIAKQAAALMCSVSTINRLRRAAKQRLAEMANRAKSLAHKTRVIPGPSTVAEVPRKLTLAEMIASVSPLRVALRT